jgi:hypothetical protein
LDPGPLPYQGFNQSFWTNYKEYLEKNYSHQTMKARLSYARRFYHVLVNNDASSLYQLNHSKRIHAMKAIVTLSKYLGYYDKWQSIRNRYNLKWTDINEQNNLTSSVYLSITSAIVDLNTMLRWLKTTLNKIPSRYGNILLFNVLTGLRPQEAIFSLKLLKSGAPDY